MEITTLIGYVAAVGAILFGITFTDNGINFAMLSNFFSVSSIFITFGGTLFVLMAAFPFRNFQNIPKHLKMVLLKDKKDPYEYIEIITELSREARKKGLLALEDKAMAFEDEFLKESVLMIVDAIEPDKLKVWFDQKLSYIDRRNQEERKFYEVGAALGPAFGMLGTLIGLVNMLKAMNLENGPEALGSSMSVALITTFYGSLIANCIFTPMANKLEIAQEREMLFKELIIEGVISIKEGENPKFIQEKLMNFLEEKEVKKDSGEADDGKKGKKKEKKEKPSK
ncbi:motility protein A [Sinanaerobacter chloroacetimidivorans]|jgi:chemotaxis protein MotA|uniref:MotA/TolQ/ExbB proton channel family protein n=1 Tax=Sinanaerobacter chloroacetimidivorans TaxID=2818044 RepID=A0A8J7W0X6_9FIRM|nr:MotA/TolQ/ExbB proton channel family protein [Sinanaerobacter chloroacetimidivorans]MBR0597538.1 MotA/TolQ/ExbB proton channel family protein [Sinanaerobacter chloroacetimidivorans]